MNQLINQERASKPPLFKAVANSTKQVYQVLKCINFGANTKVHVQISKESIRFSAEHGRTMQGVADLSHNLFTSFELNLPDADDENESSIALPRFQVSLPALLETLQIFGVTELSRGGRDGTTGDSYGYSNLRNYRADAFSHQATGLGSTCTIIYGEEGARLGIIIEEANIVTTCNLSTYLPEHEDDIPFNRNDISFKIIMLSSHLLDALTELAPSGPERVTFAVTDRAPFLSVSSAATTNLGSTSVDFSRARELLETFSYASRWVQSFRFEMLKFATEAMRISQKVSLRGDSQGVLKAQFLIPLETMGAGGVQSGVGPCFLDFTFVPSVEVDYDDDNDDDDDDDDDNDDNGDEEDEEDQGVPSNG